MITFRQFYEATSQEVQAIRSKEGIKFSTDAGHPTQRSNTVGTYTKFFNLIPENLRSGVGLDYSAGLGIGSETLRSQFNANIDSYEPFPSAKAQNITFKGLKSLPDKLYDYIFCSAVLNVVEEDIRSFIVQDIWNHLKLGGMAVIGVRSRSDVMSAKSALVIGPGEIIDRVRGSYQKGFASNELQEYVSRVLPQAVVKTVGGFNQIVVTVKKEDK